MDTKWKNSRKAGVILSLVIVLLASAATVLFYPYIEKTAKSWQESYQQSVEESSRTEHEVSVQIMNSIYQAWREEMQVKAGRILTPSQVFLPGLEEKIHQLRETAPQQEDQLYDYMDLQSSMDSRGLEWQRFARKYNPVLLYQMEDENGTVLRTNAKEEPAGYFTEDLPEGQIRLMIHFDNAGAMEVRWVQGPEKSRDRLANILSGYEFYDPLESMTSDEYLYGDIKFTPPQNVDYIYQFRLEDFSLFQPETVPVQSDYARSGGYMGVVTAVSGIVLLLALVLGGTGCLGIGTGRFCRISFEPLCFWVFCWIGLVYGMGIPAGMVYATARGLMISELTKAGILRAVAEIIEFLANMGIWALVYGMVFCLGASAGGVFRLGLWRYLKEQTWLGRLIRFLKNWAVRCLNPFNDVDWHSKSTKVILKAVAANFLIITAISFLWFFGVGVSVVYSIVLFVLIRKYWKQMESKYNLLLEAVNQMAEGNLDVEITEDLGLFEPLKEQMLRVRQGFKKAVDQEVKSQQMKTELITNVSHDLKTPLTAIITYVNLLKQPEISPEERASYIDVLEQKSMRLKVLIEDLFEISKAGSGNIVLNQEPVDIVSLLKQVKLELYSRLEESGVDFRWNLPEEKIMIWLDSQKTYRIFENLLINISKYAMKGTRAYIEITRREPPMVEISLRNISAQELTADPEELTERFARGDAARNTEGSGLGLAIAKSFTEAQGGTMEVSGEGDLFRVIIRWREMESQEKGAF